MGNKYSLDILKHLTFNKIEMKLIGTPRNDTLFDLNDEKINNTKKKLRLPLNKKIVLYAPTFRTDDFILKKNIERSGINQLAEMNINLLLEKLSDKFGGDFVFVCRFHYHVSNMVDWEALKEKYGEKIINGNESDETSDYLICTDVLISDVSGIMFDFATTKKPTFIYFPDLDNYVNKERGVYIPIQNLPFPGGVSFEQLSKNIDNYDYSKYLGKLGILMKDLGVVDSENSAKEVANYIINDSGIDNIKKPIL
jgi:CDP-glycerol glycerophosphotransferase